MLSGLGVSNQFKVRDTDIYDLLKRILCSMYAYVVYQASVTVYDSATYFR